LCKAGWHRSSVRVPYPVKLADGQVIVANISFQVMVPDTSTPPRK
jgi:hypothetical protein